MPTYIVTCGEDAKPEQVKAAKKHAEEQGGQIIHDFSLIKGFSVSFPDDAVVALKASDDILTVELDGEVTTQ